MIQNNTIPTVLLSVAFSMLLIGCGDEEKEVSKPAQDIKVVKEATRIEVVSNNNAQEIKVKVKDRDKNQSKSYYYDYNIESEYDPKAQPANKDASVRVKPRTKLDANMHIRSPYERVQISLLSGQLSHEFKVKCSACHDDYANGVIGPSLISRNADFIFDKISEFKSGVKSNPLMTDLINKMSSEEIRAMAEEIYTFNQKIIEMREKEK